VDKSSYSHKKKRSSFSGFHFNFADSDLLKPMPLIDPN